MQTLVWTDSAAECHSRSFGWGDMPYQGEHHGSYEVMTTTTTISLPESFFRWTPMPARSAQPPKHHHALASHTASSSRKRQRIRFAEHVQVRTHETILGYHPSCADGLALQCGWAYAETEFTPLNNNNNNKKKKSVREMRLDQMTRRQRLREVTGMSNLQLLQLANELLDVESYAHALKRR